MDIISFINQSAFYLGAIFVAAACLIYTSLHKNMEKSQTRIFVMMLSAIIITAICGMISIGVVPFCWTDKLARNVMYVSDYLFFAVHNTVSMCLCYYAFFATQTFSRMTGKSQTIYMIPFICSELLILTNPLNHFTWYYDASYHFRRNWAETAIYSTGIFYFVVALYYLLLRWYASTKKKRRMVFASFSITIVGTIIQLSIPILEVALFCEALTLLGLMLSVEYDDDRVDAVTRMYNRGAMIQDASYYYDTRTHFYAILLKFTNYDTYQKMPDAYSINDIFSSAANGIRSFYYSSTCYRVTPTSILILALNKNETYADELAKKVNDLFEDGLNLPKKDERLAGVIIQASAPEQIPTVQELLLMCEMDYYDVAGGSIVKGNELHEYFERAEIERAMRMGIKKHHFEVFYQIVYTTKERAVHSAEALVRLNDPKLGRLNPKDFIPAAERNGMIDIIGEFVLREVCRFIKTGIPQKLGMRYINVNLSVLQCMQSHFVERVINIVKEEDVAPSYINFEITESVAAEDYNYLASVIRECKEYGFMFSMEGYGSGYSNMYAVFSLDFDEIKLDKTMLWEADRNDHGRIILENSVRMVHEMHLPIVAVGVENKEQLSRLEKLDVEFIQGFYLSRPQSEKEIEEMILLTTGGI